MLEIFTLAVTGGSHVCTQRKGIGNGNGVSCNHAQSPDCLPLVVVRHVAPSSRVFTLFSHGSRIALFFAALMIQIFGPKQLATLTTLSVECFIILSFVVMGVSVMRLFYRNHDEDDEDTPAEKKSPTRSQQTVSSARGADNC